VVFLTQWSEAWPMNWFIAADTNQVNGTCMTLPLKGAKCLLGLALVLMATNCKVIILLL